MKADKFCILCVTFVMCQLSTCYRCNVNAHVIMVGDEDNYYSYRHPLIMHLLLIECWRIT